MPSLSFADYVTTVLPQRTEFKISIMKFTQELCEQMCQKHGINSFQIKEARKYLRVIEIDSQVCHLIVNRETGEVQLPKNRKRFHLLNSESRQSCFAELQLQCNL